MKHGRSALIVLFLGLASPAFATEPVVSVWYRGDATGAPNQNDLAIIRALGFDAITWPAARARDEALVKALADRVDLEVLLDDEPPPALSGLRQSGERVSVPAARIPAGALAALVWRAVAHGARFIAFDGGARGSAGVEDAAGRTPPWVDVATALGRTLSGNASLFDRAQPGPPVSIEQSGSPGLDVVLLDAPAAWVVIATNTGTTRLRPVVRLPSRVPYALWASLLDASELSMLSQPAGPRWTFTIEAGAALAYVIGREQR